MQFRARGVNLRFVRRSECGIIGCAAAPERGATSPR